MSKRDRAVEHAKFIRSLSLASDLRPREWAESADSLAKAVLALDEERAAYRAEIQAVQESAIAIGRDLAAAHEALRKARAALADGSDSDVSRMGRAFGIISAALPAREAVSADTPEEATDIRSDPDLCGASGEGNEPGSVAASALREMYHAKELLGSELSLMLDAPQGFHDAYDVLAAALAASAPPDTQEAGVTVKRCGEKCWQDGECDGTCERVAAREAVSADTPEGRPCCGHPDNMHTSNGIEVECECGCRVALSLAPQEGETLREALAAIRANAEAWHGPEGQDTGHARALAVIARWAADPSSIPAGVREAARAFLAASAPPDTQEAESG